MPKTDPPARRWFITALGVEFATTPLACVAVCVVATLARGFGAPLSLEAIAGFVVGAGFVFAMWALLCLRRGETRLVGGLWLGGEDE